MIRPKELSEKDVNHFGIKRIYLIFKMILGNVILRRQPFATPQYSKGNTF